MQPGDDATFRGWGRCFGGVTPRRHHFPRTAAEVRDVINSEIAQRVLGGGGGDKFSPRLALRVVGRGYSPGDLCFTDGAMLHTTRLERVLVVDAARRLVTCDGACSINDVADALGTHGLSLPTAMSVTEVTLAGACAVGAHGTGLGAASFSDSVVAIEGVTGAGDFLRASELTGENAHLLPALRCHMGMLLVVTQITVRVEPRRVFVSRSQRSTLGEVLATLDDKARRFDHYKFVWVPYTDHCLETMTRSVAVTAPGTVSTAAAAASADAAAGARNSSTGSGPIAEVSLALRSEGKTSTSLRPLRAAVSAAEGVRTALRDEQQQQEQQQRLVALPQPQPVQCSSKYKKFDPLRLVFELGFYWALDSRARLGVVHRAFHALLLRPEPPSLVDTMSANYLNVLMQHATAEWAIPRADAAAAVAEWARIVDAEQLIVNPPLEVRFSRGDDAERVWVSPSSGRDTAWLGVVVFRPFDVEPASLAAVLLRFQALMLRFGGRPHWAKPCRLAAPDVERMYARWADFERVRRQLDPHGLFVNDWFARLAAPSVAQHAGLRSML
jgi:FAD/FMN-containing dehydrogenase